MLHPVLFWGGGWGGITFISFSHGCILAATALESWLGLGLLTFLISAWGEGAWQACNEMARIFNGKDFHGESTIFTLGSINIIAFGGLRITVNPVLFLITIVPPICF